MQNISPPNGLRQEAIYETIISSRGGEIDTA